MIRRSEPVDRQGAQGYSMSGRKEACSATTEIALRRLSPDMKSDQEVDGRSHRASHKDGCQHCRVGSFYLNASRVRVFGDEAMRQTMSIIFP